MEKSPGFTLLELMVVMAIMGILLGVGIPGLGNMLSSSRMTAASNDLIYALQYARSEATKRGARVSVCPRRGNSCQQTSPPRWQSGWLIFSDAAGTVGQIDNNDTLLLTHDALSRPMRSFNSSMLLSFLSNGSSANAFGQPIDGAISLCSGASDPIIATIEIAITGRVSSTPLENQPC